jgi:hypothetical protein
MKTFRNLFFKNIKIKFSKNIKRIDFNDESYYIGEFKGKNKNQKKTKTQ